MDKKQRLEDFLPDFPSLHRCLLIDSRHSSQAEIGRELKAVDLFEDTVSAKSLKDGLGLISVQSFDACFIGPTVSAQAACEFVQSALEIGLSKDCSFIAVINPPASNAQRLRESGAHAVIIRPCNKRSFLEGVVRGIINANKDSPWIGVLMNSAEGAKLYDSIRAESLLAVANRTDRTSQLLLGSSKNFAAIALGVKEGRFGLGLDGMPAGETVKELDLLCDSMFTGSHSSGIARSFAPKIREALNQWFIDYVRISPVDAQNELKIALGEILSKV